MISLVLVVVPITFAKQKKRCMKEQLNMLGLEKKTKKTVMFTNISTTAQSVGTFV